MRIRDGYGTRQFLTQYPEMSIRPSHSDGILLAGVFKFAARTRHGEEIDDSYQLHIEVPASFPRRAPKVTEMGRKIPRNGHYHVNPDGSLCLGSPLRLLELISSRPDLTGFAQRCLVPYLYAVSSALQGGTRFPFGELAHGEPGVIHDYMVLFGLQSREQVLQTLELLGLKRRIANKRACPCRCGLRLGRCHFNRVMTKYRRLASRSWFRGEERRPGSGA